MCSAHHGRGRTIAHFLQLLREIRDSASNSSVRLIATWAFAETEARKVRTIANPLQFVREIRDSAPLVQGICDSVLLARRP